MIIYKIFIMKPVDAYVSSELYGLSEMPKGIISNIKRYLTSVYSDFDSKWFIFFSSHIVCICCIIGVAV